MAVAEDTACTTGFHSRTHRPHRRAFTHDFERHALPDFTLRTPIFDQRLDRPTEHVDETGRDRQAVQLDFAVSISITNVAQRSDAICVESDITAHGRLPA